MRIRCVRAAGVAAILAVSAPWLLAQDRPVSVIDTEPAPAIVEAGTFFLMGGLVATTVRNRHTARVLVTLRSWVFDQSGRFKGTNSYCMGEWLDRGTRRVQSTPIEVKDLVASDVVVVAVEHVASDGREWTWTDSDDTVLAVARRVSLGVGRRLRFEERRVEGEPTTFCRCECPPIGTWCEQQCAVSGLRAFTCSPAAADGCSASCTCK